MASNKNILDLPESQTTDSSTYLHQSRGGIDEKILVDNFIDQLNSDDPYTVTPKNEPSDSVVLGLPDRKAYIRCLSDSETNIEVPTDEAAGWSSVTEVYIRRAGEGNVLVSGAVGVTVNPAQVGLILSEDGQVGKLLRIGINEWDFICNGVEAPIMPPPGAVLMYTTEDGVEGWSLTDDPYSVTTPIDPYLDVMGGAINFDPVNNLLATGDQNIYIYDTTTRPFTLLETLTPSLGGGEIRILEFSPDGSLLFFGNDQLVDNILYDTSTWTPTVLDSDGVFDATFSGDSALLATTRIGGSGLDIKLYDTSTGLEEAGLPGTGTTNNYTYCAAHPTHNILCAWFSGGNDLYTWNLDTRAFIGIWGGITSTVRALQFSLDGNRLLSKETATEVWDSSAASTGSWTSLPFNGGDELPASASGTGGFNFSADSNLLSCWQDVDVGDERIVFDLTTAPIERVTSFDVLPTGSTFIQSAFINAYEGGETLYTASLEYTDNGDAAGLNVSPIKLLAAGQEGFLLPDFDVSFTRFNLDNTTVSTTDYNVNGISQNFTIRTGQYYETGDVLCLFPEQAYEITGGSFSYQVYEINVTANTAAWVDYGLAALHTSMGLGDPEYYDSVIDSTGRYAYASVVDFTNSRFAIVKFDMQAKSASSVYNIQLNGGGGDPYVEGYAKMARAGDKIYVLPFEFIDTGYAWFTVDIADSDAVADFTYLAGTITDIGAFSSLGFPAYSPDDDEVYYPPLSAEGYLINDTITDTQTVDDYGGAAISSNVTLPTSEYGLDKKIYSYDSFTGEQLGVVTPADDSFELTTMGQTAPAFFTSEYSCTLADGSIVFFADSNNATRLAVITFTEV